MRRILALILVLFLVGTTTPAGQEKIVYGAAATPVSRHGRLSVKGADLVDASRNKFQLRGISTSSTGKWLTRLNKYNISYFCWSLSNKNESCSLLASRTKKTSQWKTSDLTKAGQYIRSKYRARKKALGSKA